MLTHGPLTGEDPEGLVSGRRDSPPLCAKGLLDTVSRGRRDWSVAGLMHTSAPLGGGLQWDGQLLGGSRRTPHLWPRWLASPGASLPAHATQAATGGQVPRTALPAGAAQLRASVVGSVRQSGWPLGEAKGTGTFHLFPGLRPGSRGSESKAGEASLLSEPGGRPAGAVFLSGNLPPRVLSCHWSVNRLESLGIWRGGSFQEL